MTNTIEITEKTAVGNGDLSGTRLACSCGWIATTSLQTEVANLAYEHAQYHAKKEGRR